MYSEDKKVTSVTPAEKKCNQITGRLIKNEDYFTELQIFFTIAGSWVAAKRKTLDFMPGLE